MSVWLTPSLQPFYGGTYFPPTSRWGKPGFAKFSKRSRASGGKSGRRSIRSAANMVERLRTFGAQRGGGEVPSAAVLERATAEFRGGIRRAPGGIRQRAEVSATERTVVPAREHARTGKAETGTWCC
jgi:uncharacterized protein YyaL (SSP411 family)